MCGIQRTDSPTKAWGWYVNGGDVLCFGLVTQNHVPSSADAKIEYLDANGTQTNNGSGRCYYSHQ